MALRVTLTLSGLLLFVVGCYAYPVEVKLQEGTSDVAKPAAPLVVEVQQPELVKEEAKSPVPVVVVEVPSEPKRPGGFQGYDQDGNGFLDAQEWERLLAAEEIKRDFALADLNGDNMLSLDEYENAPWNAVVPPKQDTNEVYVPASAPAVPEVLLPSAREQPGVIPPVQAVLGEPVPAALAFDPVVPQQPQESAIPVVQDSVDIASIPAKAVQVPEASAVISEEQTVPAALAVEEPVLPQVKEEPLVKELVPASVQPQVQEASVLKDVPLVPQIQEAPVVKEVAAPLVPQVQEAPSVKDVVAPVVPQIQEAPAVKELGAPVVSSIQEAQVVKESAPVAPVLQEAPVKVEAPASVAVQDVAAAKEAVESVLPVKAEGPAKVEAAQSDPAVVVLEQVKVELPAVVSQVEEKAPESVKSSSSEESSKQEEVVPPKQPEESKQPEQPVESDVKDSDESKESDEESPSNVIRL